MADVTRILKLDRVYANLDYLKITLPSDPDWQLSTYKKLVEKQRDMSKQDSTIDGPVSMASSLKVGYLFETAFQKPSKETDGLLDREYILELENESVVDKFDRNTELWTNRELVLAAKVLSTKTPKRHGIKFASDNQMRRVYDIIFEVFRYRTIINEILNNIDFENIYQNYSQMTLLVWLMSFDYYRNKFKPRKLDENETISFKALKLLEIADILKDIKIQLAASFSKFKIKHCALSLSDMLPKHLRNERFKKSSETIISCWINTFLTSPEYVVNVLNKAGFIQMKNFEDLVSETYKMDHLLPYFIHIYPKEKSEFLNKMPLFQKYLLILQERRYCLGPAMLDRTMSANKLCGNVAQTHFTIQTAVAYLSSLLFKRKQSLIVYGAADRKSDYYNYFVNLGVQNCKLIADDFLQLSSNNQISLDIVSILATPPNTNTGVTDPVQLVCSKGGDLTLLRAVASLDYTEESSNIPCMLDQRDTLRMAMSKPQVQIVVYETHSRLELENGGMVKAVVEEMNGWAYEKHNMENYSSISADDKFSTSVETPWRPTVFQPVEIPDKDRFETMILYPDKTIENMEKNNVTGSLYLAAVKRVELMTFDANHLIRMAEQRGLFGKPVKGRKPKIPSPIILSLANSDEPRVKLKFEQMHVLVPTHTFVQRCTSKTIWCPRFSKAYDKTSMATRWWRISINHVIKSLRKPFFVWTKVQMVRLGKRTNRTPLCLKNVTATFKQKRTKKKTKWINTII